MARLNSPACDHQGCSDFRCFKADLGGWLVFGPEPQSQTPWTVGQSEEEEIGHFHSKAGAQMVADALNETADQHVSVSAEHRTAEDK